MQGEAVPEARSEVAAGEPLCVTLGDLEVDLVRVTLSEGDLLRVTEVQEETVAKADGVGCVLVCRTHASKQRRSTPLLLIV